MNYGKANRGNIKKLLEPIQQQTLPGKQRGRKRRELHPLEGGRKHIAVVVGET